MNVLVTGGAGYIGSHICKMLSETGNTPITMDNLSRGQKSSVQWGPFYQGNISNRELLRQIFRDQKIHAVIHMAAFAYVGESVNNPQLYNQNNTIETQYFLEHLYELTLNIPLVFSSTCSVYGQPEELPITETSAVNIINPYANSKYKVEGHLKNLCASHNTRACALRYFNAAGADTSEKIGFTKGNNERLIPLAIKAAFDVDYTLSVFGTDYPTKDGTCIRDYVHVNDLATAHIKALSYIIKKPRGYFDIFNLGSGTGISVKEIVEAIEEFSGHKVKLSLSDRREGDPAILIASSEKAFKELAWSPQQSSLKELITTSLRWYKKNENLK